MDRYFAILGLISILIAGSLAAESVQVSNDIQVKPTQEPLLDPANRVDVTLNCTGSRSDLSYYIKNRVQWVFEDSKGKRYNVTQSFYKDPKSAYAERHFSSGHFGFKYFQDAISKLYVFSLSINGVNRADNGVYKCSLIDEGNTVIDSKEVKLTVMNPVESVAIEIHDANHNVIARSKKPATSSKPGDLVRLTPGQYMVKCDARGSNPEPVMNLFINDEKPYVSTRTEKDASSEFESYTGTFTVDSLTIKAHNAPQTLVCQANIAGEYYPSAEAGIALFVQIDKPTIKCGNFTASVGDRQSKVNCNVSAGENSQALKCDKLSWFLSVKGQKIMAVQRWKDTTKEYDMVESMCQETNEGINIQLMLYTVKEKMFKETYFLVYGEGENAHRKPITLYDVTVAAAGIATPLSLLACLIVAFVSTFITRL